MSSGSAPTSTYGPNVCPPWPRHRPSAPQKGQALEVALVQVCATPGVAANLHPKAPDVLSRFWREVSETRVTTRTNPLYRRLRLAISGLFKGFGEYMQQRTQAASARGSVYPDSPALATETPEALVQKVGEARTDSEKEKILALILARQDVAACLMALSQAAADGSVPLYELWPRMKDRQGVTQEPSLFPSLDPARAGKGRTVAEEMLIQLRHMDALLSAESSSSELLANRSQLLRLVSLFLVIGRHAGSQGQGSGLRQVKDGKVRFVDYQKLSAQIFSGFVRENMNPHLPAGQQLSEAEIALGEFLILKQLSAINYLNGLRAARVDLASGASEIAGKVSEAILGDSHLGRFDISGEEVLELGLRVVESYLMATGDPKNPEPQEKIRAGFRTLAYEARRSVATVEAKVLRKRNPPLADEKEISRLIVARMGKDPKSLSPNERQKVRALSQEIEGKVYAQQQKGQILSLSSAIQLALAYVVAFIPEGVSLDLEAAVRVSHRNGDLQASATTIERGEMPSVKRILGIRTAHKCDFTAADGSKSAVRVHKSDPASQFKGEVDDEVLRKAIGTNHVLSDYPVLCKAIQDDESLIGLIKEALAKKGFRNLHEVELFVSDAKKEKSVSERLTEVDVASSPMAPFLEIRRTYQGEPVTIEIRRGWQGGAEHTGEGGLHFSAQRAKKLVEEFRRSGEPIDPMLERFIVDVTIHILATSTTEIPSDRDPTKVLLLGKAGGESGGFGAIVIDRSDPRQWKVITNMYQPDGRGFRQNLARNLLRQLWKTWGEGTGERPEFKQAWREVNRFLIENGQTALGFLETMPDERLKPLREAIGRKVSSSGIPAKKVEELARGLVQFVFEQPELTSIESAQDFLEGPVFTARLGEVTGAMLAKMTPKKK